MLATLNASQIVDEIVKDAVRDNDPHDAIHIAPEIVMASRAVSATPKLAPEIAIDREPRVSPASDISTAPEIGREPRFSSASGASDAAFAGEAAMRVTVQDDRGVQAPSAGGKWLRGALVTMLFAGGSAAATIAWDRHGDAARRMLAEWTPAVTALVTARSQTAQPAEAPTASSEPAAAPDTPPPAAQQQAATPAVSADAIASVQSLTRDVAAMAQQIDQLKASLAEVKAGQEQIAREMAKPAAPKLASDARPAADAHARLAAPAHPPVRKPKPALTRSSTPSYPPAPLAPPPPLQAAAVPPPPPSATPQAVADDDGPVVRPPMPLR